MKIKNVTLTNFKRISNNVVPSLECNEDFNILVGANNSGKTSILEAVAGLFGIKEVPWHRCLAYSLKGNGQLVVKATVFFNTNEWSILIDIFGKTQQKPSNTLVNWNKDNIPQLENVPIEISQTINLKEGKVISSQRTSSISPEFDNERQKVFESANSQNWLSNLVRNIINQDFYNAFNHPIYLSSSNFIITKEKFVAENEVINDRIPTSHIPAKLYYVKQNDFSKFKKIRQEILQVFPEIKNFDIILNTKDGTFDFVLQEDILSNGSTFEVPYDVADVGMGMQNLLVIVSNILLLEPSIVLMDEPDAHMHPALVKNFIEIIKKLSDKTQFLLTTHSVPLIEAVELNKIFNLNYKQEEKGTIISNIKHPNELLQTVESLGYNISNLQYASQPNVVVFCEGVSDKKYIFDFAKRLGKAKEINEFTTVFIPMGGKGERFKLARLIEKLNKDYLDKPVLMLLDSDEGTEEQKTELRDKYFKENPNRLFYLSKRQIENYLLETQAIKNLTLNRLKDASLIDKFNTIDLDVKFLSLANEQREKILLNYIEEKFINQSFIATKDLRKILDDLELKPLNESVKKFMGEISRLLTEKTFDLSNETKTIVDLYNSDWDNPQKRIDMCDGRELLKSVRRWLQDDFKISFSDTELIDAIIVVPEDITNLIGKLCSPEELMIPINKKPQG